MKEILVFSWITWISVPIILGIISILLGFWTRGRIDKSFGGVFQKFKYNKIMNVRNWEGGDTVFSWFLIDVIIVGILHLLFGAIFYHFSYFGLYIILSILGFIIIPRYIGDILNSLRYCFKSKESLRLKELERQVELLKNK